MTGAELFPPSRSNTTLPAHWLRTKALDARELQRRRLPANTRSRENRWTNAYLRLCPERAAGSGGAHPDERIAARATVGCAWRRAGGSGKNVILTKAHSGPPVLPPMLETLRSPLTTRRPLEHSEADGAAVIIGKTNCD